MKKSCSDPFMLKSAQMKKKSHNGLMNQYHYALPVLVKL